MSLTNKTIRHKVNPDGSLSPAWQTYNYNEECGGDGSLDIVTLGDLRYVTAHLPDTTPLLINGVKPDNFYCYDKPSMHFDISEGDSIKGINLTLRPFNP